MVRHVFMGIVMVCIAMSFTPPVSLRVLYWYTTDDAGTQLRGRLDINNSAIGLDEAIKRMGCLHSSANCCAKGYLLPYLGEFPTTAPPSAQAKLFH